MKARDKAGLESATVNSTNILVDTTPPGGISCSNFRLQDETTLRFSPTSSFLHDRYAGTLTADAVGPNELMKLELLAVGLDHAAGGHFETEDVKMPVYFKYAHSAKQLLNTCSSHRREKTRLWYFRCWWKETTALGSRRNCIDAANRKHLRSLPSRLNRYPKTSFPSAHAYWTWNLGSGPCRSGWGRRRGVCRSDP